MIPITEVFRNIAKSLDLESWSEIQIANPGTDRRLASDPISTSKTELEESRTIHDTSPWEPHQSSKQGSLDRKLLEAKDKISQEEKLDIQDHNFLYKDPLLESPYFKDLSKLDTIPRPPSTCPSLSTDKGSKDDSRVSNVFASSQGFRFTQSREGPSPLSTNAVQSLAPTTEAPAQASFTKFSGQIASTKPVEVKTMERSRPFETSQAPHPRKARN